MNDSNAAGVNARQKRYFIGVPFLLLVALSLPLMILLAPVILVAGLMGHVNPFDTFRVLWNLLKAVRGTYVEVSGHSRSVLVHVG